MLWEHFKVPAPSRTAVGYLKTNCQRRTHICQRPFIYYTQLLATALWKSLESVCNGAMNILSPNVLIFCRQRRNELLADVGNCAMMPVAAGHSLAQPVHATQDQALLIQVRMHWGLCENGETQFSPWKGRHKCRLTLRRNGFHSCVGNSFPNCQPNSCTRWRRFFKGLSQDRGWADFSKKPPRLSL